MAGGRKIDDHSSMWGSAEKGEVFPKGAKVKMEKSADGAGELSEYWDTTEKIKEQQDMGERKVGSHRMKPGYRN
jgi:hypothetical protein